MIARPELDLRPQDRRNLDAVAAARPYSDAEKIELLTKALRLVIEHGSPSVAKMALDTLEDISGRE